VDGWRSDRIVHRRSAAALAVLAIDEVWEFHERSSQVVGDDDPLKVVGWIGSGLVLLWIASRETPLRAASREAHAAGWFRAADAVLVPCRFSADPGRRA
jgi:hypothetical protein